MARKRILQSSDSGQQTWLINNGRIFVFLILFVLIGGISKLYFSSAAVTQIVVTGRVYDSRTGKSISGVIITGCNGHYATTGSNVVSSTRGTYNWRFSVGKGGSYCARVGSGLPSGLYGPVTNNRANHSTSKTYEFQIAGIDCIHYPSTAQCDANADSWDREVDYGVNFKYASPPPHPNNVSTSNVTNSSIKVNWVRASDTAGVISYDIYRGGSKIYSVSSASTSYTNTGLSARTSYSYYVKARDSAGHSSSASNTASATTSANPPPPPPPKPTISSFKATPSTISKGSSSTLSWSSNGSSCKLKGGITNRVVGGSGTHKVFPSYTTRYSIYCYNSGGNSSTKYATVTVTGSGSGASVPVPTPHSSDKQAPSKPTGFTAAMNTEVQAVSLSWQAATDNVAVLGYKLERSENKKQWDIVDPDISDTTYQDSAVSFEVHYYYRIASIDTTGNVSGYALTDIVTSSFSANVSADKEATITSSDNVASVYLPAGSVTSDVFCDISPSTDVAAPAINNLKLISGPYTFNCRDKDGAQITSFEQTLGLTIQLNKQLLKGIDKVQIYGQSEDQSWQQISLTSQDNKKMTYSTDLGDYQTVVVMGTKKKGSILFTIIKILIVLALIVLLIRFVLKLLAKRRAESQYEEYLHKSKGL